MDHRINACAGMDILENLKELKALHDNGDLTTEEFEKAKERLLQEEKTATPLGWLYPILIILIVGLIFWLAPREEPNNTKIDKEKKETEQASRTVNPQGTYYIFLSLIELADKNPVGDEWDTGGSLPDITYTISRNGREIFKAPRNGENSTITEWTGVSQDFSLLKTTVSLEGTIKAALVSINPNDTLKIQVWDTDDLSPDDEAGEFTLATSSLKLGQSEWWRYGDTWSENHDNKKPVATRGLKRLRLHVIDSKRKSEFIANQLDIPLEKVNTLIKKLEK